MIDIVPFSKGPVGPTSRSRSGSRSGSGSGRAPCPFVTAAPLGRLRVVEQAREQEQKHHNRMVMNEADGRDVARFELSCGSGGGGHWVVVGEVVS